MYVAPSAGAWVLAIGAARYVFLAAGWLLAWMRAPLPPRDWRKVVAATQGITLTVAAADVLPPALTQAALAVALALLAESFGRDVWWLWRHRHAADRAGAAARDRARHGRHRRRAHGPRPAARVGRPGRTERAEPAHARRVRAAPARGLVVVALALVLPGPRRGASWRGSSGRCSACWCIVKLLDVGFFTAFDRPFNPVDDWSYADIGVETLRDSIGRTDANLADRGRGAARRRASASSRPWRVLRLTRVAAGHRRRSLRAVAALGAVWVLCWAFGAQLVSGAPIASTSAADLAVARGARGAGRPPRPRALRRARSATTASAHTPGDRLLTGLRGKDVLLVFVESYGKVAVQGSSFSPRVDAVLDAGTRQLRGRRLLGRAAACSPRRPSAASAGWRTPRSSRGSGSTASGATTSSSQSDRFTLSQAFERAGWRTVDDVPSNNRDWPQGSSFYHYDKVYDRRNVGYRGPTFAYASMPDQYVLAGPAAPGARAGPTGRPLFAEVDLVSSHAPWTRIPPLIDWSDVGDGSIFNRLAGRRRPRSRATSSSGVRPVDRVHAERAVLVRRSTTATRTSCWSCWATTSPRTIVTGYGASHDVPISVIAHDPAVLRPDRRVGLERRHAPRPAGAGLADERLPRPLPAARSARPATRAAMAR